MDLKLIKSKDIRDLKEELKSIKNVNIEMQEEWLGTIEAAKYLKICTKTLQRYRHSGKLPYSKDGRKIRYKKSDLINYLQKHYFSIEELNK